MWMCDDLNPFNTKVDDTLALLHGATVFSKLEANSGFWQIRLAETSLSFTTFITPFGNFHFSKLPSETHVPQSCSREE